MADLGEPVGSAFSYRRLFIVVQCVALNRSGSATTLCVPLTTTLKRTDAPENVLLRTSERVWTAIS